MILTLAHLRKIVEVFFSKCKWIKTSFKKSSLILSGFTYLFKNEENSDFI